MAAQYRRGQEGGYIKAQDYLQTQLPLVPAPPHPELAIFSDNRRVCLAAGKHEGPGPQTFVNHDICQPLAQADLAI